MKNIRRAEEKDVSRIAEILVFNNRLNFYPIFQDEAYSFGELQVVPMANELLADSERLGSIYVYDDGVVRGLVLIQGKEIKKLYVDPAFQGRGIGDKLLRYAVEHARVNYLWALEKNVRAIAFYERHGFHLTGEKIPEEDTVEFLVRMER